MSHDHAPKNYNRAFTIGIALNLGFVIIEAIYGSLVDSLALIADAGHNFSDVLSLLLAFGASVLATRKPTKKRTYGLRRVTILASLISALLLVVALGAIAWEAASRFTAPREVNGRTMMIVAGIGVAINTATALMFVSGQKHDLNIRGAFLHMAADAVISVGVVVAGVAIIMTGWLWLDPALSLVIVGVILLGTWRLLRDSVDLSIDAVPRDIDSDAVEEYLKGLPVVSDLHDLHIWALSTTETALTVHLVTTEMIMERDFLKRISQTLHKRFRIDHATIQIENYESADKCDLNPCDEFASGSETELEPPE